MKRYSLILAAGLALAGAAAANERDEYNLRGATADMAVFHQLARDGVLTRDDVKSDLNFAPRFDAADVNRDGVVTAEEMRRYIEQTYEITGTIAQPSASAGSGSR